MSKTCIIAIIGLCILARATSADNTFIAIEGGNIGEVAPKNIQVPPFLVQKHEVTVGQYMACVDAGVCELWRAPSEHDDLMISGGEDNITYVTPSPSREDMPIDPIKIFLNQYGQPLNEIVDFPLPMVTSEQADTYCGWIDARLPTYDEYRYLLRVHTVPALESYLSMMSDNHQSEVCTHFALPSFDPRAVADQNRLEDGVDRSMVQICNPEQISKFTNVEQPTDLLGSLNEWYAGTVLGSSNANALSRSFTGGSWLNGYATLRGFTLKDGDRLIDTGFRCAKNG